METIIGLLFILLPVIFKLIGKRLDKSGSPDTARKVREFAEALDGEESPMHDWKYLGEQIFSNADEGQGRMDNKNLQEQIESVPVSIEYSQTHLEKPVAKRPILIEEDIERKAEKIDPKKLVIYSEIMKPKF